jgi:hypothetical protein
LPPSYSVELLSLPDCHAGPLSTLCTFLPERIPGSRVMYWMGQLQEAGAMPDRRIKFKSESVMAGLYLGIAVTGVNALVGMALVIAFM